MHSAVRHDEGAHCPPAARWKWLGLLTGLASLAWFLVRVIPKPSRAAYPCQRAAAPLASGFVLWLAGVAGGALLQRKVRVRFGAIAAVAATVALAAWISLGTTGDLAAQQAFTPADAPNKPIGTAKGIHPGRVVWVRDTRATSWDGRTGEWWDDSNTNAAVINRMVSDALRSLTGARTDKQAWQALFEDFKKTHGEKGGYRPGEKIAIKINSNQDQGTPWRTGQGMPSPHVVYAVVEQLVKSAGVAGKDITIYDASRYIGDPIYDRIKSASDPNIQAVSFVVSPSRVKDGRVEAAAGEKNPIHFAGDGIPTAYIPRQVVEATYLINLALLRAHTLCGVTLCAKNHFGSTYFPNNRGWTPQPLHATTGRGRPMGSYNSLVELIGHKHLGGKTLLYMIDGLYSSEHQQGNAMRLASFGDQWAASLFASQDPVAIDSVGLDFLRNEPKATQVRGNPDNYLHEAAVADHPPSGTVYDPEGDGTRLASLGVHEHWNNATDRKYSRNLKTGAGIELVALSGEGAGGAR